MMNDGVISYSNLIDGAMRGVIRDVLRQIEVTGLTGDHHFYITFLTEHPGAEISDTLRSRYPQEMTIVLQHQFWDFRVEEDYFTVALSFGGMPERLVIPFASLVAFADPSVKFGLQFQKIEALQETLPMPMDYERLLSTEARIPGEGAEEEDDNTAEIISLDAFRKK